MSDKPAKIDLSSLRDDPDALIGIIAMLGKFIDELRGEIVEFRKLVELLREENARLREENARLRKENEDTNGRLEKIEREAHRQAAPFRVDEKKRKKSPKKPGRRKGHKGVFRERPDHVDEVIEVALEECPNCGGAVGDVRALEQFIEEIPPVRPHVTRLVTHEGRCPRCGDVRSTHPLQVSTASGAAGTHLGPRALGVALELDQRHGLTKRKTCAVLRELFGLRLSPGGLVHAAHRMAGKLAEPFKDLENQVKNAPFIHADETSWWVGGPKWWLWVYTRPDVTLYRVRSSRGRDVIYETLGPDYAGVLVSDCLNIYDDVCNLQHKCYSHHLKAIGKAIEQHPKGGAGFLGEARSLLTAAMALKKTLPALSEIEKRQYRRALDATAQRLLHPARGDPLEESVANRLRKQRDHLFTFLDHDGVEATNNLAERQLRPAVIARKLSCGNRTERGARTWEILMSFAATLAQRQESFRDFIKNTARLQHTTA